MMDEPSVVAILLTHNAPESLSRCLEAIDGQSRPPDAVLVIDNASREPATLGERGVPASLLRRAVNDGPAGGHAAGLAEFRDSAHDYAWVLDDDCIPEPGCLAALVARASSVTDGSPLFPLWVDAPTGEARFLPAWCGFLIARATVDRIGLPRADLVWWAEDTEYLQWRVLEAGLRAVEVPEAVVEHHRVRTASAKPPWKMYYEVRNTILYRVYVQRWTWTHVRLLARSLAGLASQAIRNGPGRSARIRAFARGMADGLLRRTGLRVPLP
jgi:GT2 family glycosyltransferase